MRHTSRAILMEEGIEWRRESNFRAEKVQVAPSVCDPGQAWWGSGHHQRKRCGRVWKAEENWQMGTSRIMSREKVHPKQARLGGNRRGGSRPAGLEHSASLTSQLPPERRHKVERTTCVSNLGRSRLNRNLANLSGCPRAVSSLSLEAQKPVLHNHPSRGASWEGPSPSGSSPYKGRSFYSRVV